MVIRNVGCMYVQSKMGGGHICAAKGDKKVSPLIWCFLHLPIVAYTETLLFHGRSSSF